MNISESYTIQAERSKVWQLLMDPEVLAACIPGCQSLEPQGDGTYAAVLKIGIGPVKGTFTGKLTLKDIREPEEYTMLVDGQGGIGFVRGSGHLSLIDLGGSTEVKIEGEANVGGTIAQIGSRMVGPASKMMMNQFFNAIKTRAEASP